MNTHSSYRAFILSNFVSNISKYSYKKILIIFKNIWDANVCHRIDICAKCTFGGHITLKSAAFNHS